MPGICVFEELQSDFPNVMGVRLRNQALGTCHMNRSRGLSYSVYSVSQSLFLPQLVHLFPTSNSIIFLYDFANVSGQVCKRKRTGHSQAL
jgi:hypothetical protein